MTTNDLIRLLIDNRIKLIPQPNGGLDVDGPGEMLTPKLIEELRRHNPTILHRMTVIERNEKEPVCRHLERLIF
jgi:hypothetical protein